MQSNHTETPEMNRRICTLIMRGLSATEATEQAGREAFAKATRREVQSDITQRRIAAHASTARVNRLAAKVRGQ